ncbi:sulfite exporter TauE/SafE family protein [Paeniglutamicibacter gangotriensis]|uniref:Probable membrane transporter protein n=1 Tax=Paeniglutamicibacter gangotriensis Lz1y TaxID=1276920 RepID=M7N9F7_9MICC|nr:sulfite exporter TauE/SafE family protein [Paeniglutamicibacter gangotriensis]EMQ98419.1 putative integral membrane protein [Paeniglutamicibacter gangotriensis Lz1y]
MDLWRDIIIFFAGLWAGTINTIVGSGSLVTFPVLVALGFAPVNAVVSNAMGLIAGGFSGAWGYRREAATVWRTMLKLVPVSLVGGLIGAYLLLHLPDTVFGYVAPVLIVLALLLVIFQPRLSAWAKKRQAASVGVNPAEADKAQIGVGLYVMVFFIGIYGGYFTAAQGILLMAVFGIFLHASLQQSNAIKVILSLVVNMVAAISYLIFAPERIHWPVVLMIAVGSLIGGFIGAKVGRKLSPGWLRTVIVVLGMVALVNMVAKLFVGS